MGAQNTGTKEVKIGKLTNQLETAGGGNCGFHATLGSYDTKTKEFTASNIKETREKAAEEVKNSKTNANLFPLVKEAILYVIQNRNPSGAHLQEFKKWYQAEHDQAVSTAKNTFDEELSNAAHNGFVTMIRNFSVQLAQSKGKTSQEIQALESNLHEQFESWSTEETQQTKDAAFLLDPTIKAAYDIYEKSANTPINTDQWFQDSKVDDLLKEYSELIGKVGEWSSAQDIPIIAYVFNKNVTFYTGDVNKMQAVQYKYGGISEEITVWFDANHFWRMVDPIAEMNKLLQQTSKPTTPDQDKSKELVDKLKKDFKDLIDKIDNRAYSSEDEKKLYRDDLLNKFETQVLSIITGNSDSAIKKTMRSKKIKALIAFIMAVTITLITGAEIFTKSLSGNHHTAVAALSFALYVVNGLSVALATYLGHYLYQDAHNDKKRAYQVSDWLSSKASGTASYLTKYLRGSPLMASKSPILPVTEMTPDEVHVRLISTV